MVEVSTSIEPGPDARVYESICAIHRDMYPALKDSFVRLSEV
jgi:hypothetical protein